MTSAQSSWGRLTCTAGGVVILLAITSFITSAANNLSALSPAAVGVALCLVATTASRRRPSGLVVTTATALAASGIAAAGGALANLFGPTGDEHVDYTWTIASHVAVAVVLAAYILATVRLTGPTHATATPLPGHPGPHPTALPHPPRSRYGRRR